VDFTDWVMVNEKPLRSGIFFGMLIMMGLFEIVAPRRKRLLPRLLRWSNNLALLVLNIVIARWLFPLAAVGVAAYVASNGWGLMNVYEIPFTLAIVLSVIALDFIIYLQHVLVHAVPALWRLHRVHHADPDLDVTSGLRFHPIEIILSLLIKFAAIVVLGAPVIAVVIFEILLNAGAMFNHANVRLPLPVDKFLRWFIVTPDMHRIHHSVEDDEANTNFGFNLTWWDRLFGTYTVEPRGGQEGMTVGIRHYNDPKQVSWLHGLLILPFRKKIGGYTINRRNWNEDNES